MIQAERLRIAVIIPTFKRPRYLREALESVFSQTLAPSEIIVVDDGNDPETRELCNQFTGLSYVYQTSPSGPSAARNLGVKLCESDYLAFLDDDDRYFPDALERLAGAMLQLPENTLVYGRTNRIDEHGRTVGEDLKNHRQPSRPLAALAHENFIRIQATLVSRKAFLDAGGFDPEMRHAEDLDLWIRVVGAGGGLVFLDRLVTDFRTHQGGASRSKARMATGFLRAIEKNIALLGEPRAAWLAGGHYRVGRALMEEGDFESARTEFKLAAGQAPRQLRYRVFQLLAHHPAAYGFALQLGGRLKAAVRKVLTRLGLAEQRWG